MEAIEDSLKDPDEENLRKAIEASNKEAEQEIHRKVIENINSIFGSDLSNLYKVTELQTSLNKKLGELDSKLDVANSSAPTQLQIALSQG